MVRVFVSGSGEQGRAVARALCTWLPGVVQAAEPCLLEAPAEGSEGWTVDVEQALKGGTFYILCVTRDHRTSPGIDAWAEALPRHFSERAVCLYLLGTDPTVLGGAIAGLPRKRADKPQTREMVLAINANTAKPRDAQVIAKAFHAFWPELVADLSRILGDTAGAWHFDPQPSQQDPWEVTSRARARQNRDLAEKAAREREEAEARALRESVLRAAAKAQRAVGDRPMPPGGPLDDDRSADRSPDST
ncbi:hypothetical protein [Chondromyces apiculatus]|uniref:Uncharacterized protein n=1 Tax=Chondromyces apiculatus DSM 436 TaxID=1192034 RepID=A0A017TJ19_9BACT|nr:hypothetical protein [Chondromyces apiculatus]EYF08892.1 Hypothetical protein CAP_2753 [Chondromyces apiculatus DSM 436]